MIPLDQILHDNLPIIPRVGKKLKFEIIIAGVISILLPIVIYVIQQNKKDDKIVTIEKS